MSHFRDLPRRSYLQLAGALPFLGTSSTLDGGEPNLDIETTTSFIRLSNSHLQISFRKDSGGVHQIRDIHTNTKLRDPTTGYPSTVWGLEFYYGGERPLLTNSARASFPDFSTSDDGSKVQLTLQWEDPSLKVPGGEPPVDSFAGTIEMTVTLQRGEPFCRWEIAVDNQSDLAVKTISAPLITGISAIDDQGDDAVILPRQTGRRYSNPTQLEYSPYFEYPSGFGTMQFTAFTGPNGGFYADARDEGGHFKSFEWRPQESGTLGFSIDHFIPNQNGESINLPYETTFGVLRGDWHEAANRYREWASSSGFLSEADPEPPEWVLNNGLSYMVTSYTRFDRPQETVEFPEVVRWARRMKRHLDVSLMIEWRGWSHQGFPSPGAWMPPKEGLESFTETIRDLQRHGIDTNVFINVTNLIEDSEFWRTNQSDASEWIIKRRDGSLEQRQSQTAGYTLLQPEPTHEGWQRHVRSTLDKIITAGAKELHLDGLCWQGAFSCYDETHSHPPGRGGNWYPQRLAEDLAEIRSRYVDERPYLALSGEGIADYYLEDMDIHNTRDVMAEVFDPAIARGDAEQLPLLMYTLGDYYLPRGLMPKPPSLVNPQRSVQRLWIGRALVKGMQLQFSLPEEIDDPATDQEMLDFIGRAGRARESYAHRFVTSGNLLRAPNLETETITLQAEWGDVTAETEAIISSAWKSQRDEVGVVLTNVSDSTSPRDVNVDLSSQHWSIPENPLVYTVLNGRYERVGKPSTRLTLEQSDVVLLAATQNTQAAREAIEKIEAAQDSTSVEEDILRRAKRKFDQGMYEKAVSLATQATVEDTERTDSPTTEAKAKTSSSDRRGASTSSPKPSESSPEPTTALSGTSSSASGPGFGILETIAGVTGIAALIHWLRDSDDE